MVSVEQQRSASHNRTEWSHDPVAMCLALDFPYLTLLMHLSCDRGQDEHQCDLRIYVYNPSPKPCMKLGRGAIHRGCQDTPRVSTQIRNGSLHTSNTNHVSFVSHIQHCYHFPALTLQRSGLCRRFARLRGAPSSSSSV